jgi:integrase
LKKILASATGPLRAFVLLALNCGMYAADIAQLRHHDLRREGRHLVIDDDRGKTGIVRRAILWPETVKAIEGLRRGEDLLFVTAHGNPWVNGETDSIGLLFRRLLDELGVKRAGVGFGSLKHTHVSAVGGHPDLNAARLVRGHKFSGIEAHYDFPDLETDQSRHRPGAKATAHQRWWIIESKSASVVRTFANSDRVEARRASLMNFSRSSDRTR